MLVCSILQQVGEPKVLDQQDLQGVEEAFLAQGVEVGDPLEEQEEEEAPFLVMGEGVEHHSSLVEVEGVD